MKYYKQMVNNEVTAYLSGSATSESDDLVEITEEEYNAAIQKLKESAEESETADEESMDARIAELEKENAALKSELASAIKK